MTGKSTRALYLFELMQRIGVDPSRRSIAQSELTFLTALNQCRNCKSNEQCRAWLDQAPMSFAFAPGFCPNKDLLFEMQFDQGEPPLLGGALEPDPPQ
jgi:hypothetical protein